MLVSFDVSFRFVCSSSFVSLSLSVCQVPVHLRAHPVENLDCVKRVIDCNGLRKRGSHCSYVQVRIFALVRIVLSSKVSRHC